MSEKHQHGTIYRRCQHPWLFPATLLVAFWLLFTLIATLPAFSTLPQERVTILSGIGAIGLICETLLFYSNNRHTQLNTLFRRLIPVASISFAVLFLVLQPIAIAGSTVVQASKPKLLDQAATMQRVDASAGKVNVFINSPHVRTLPSLIIAAHYL